MAATTGTIVHMVQFRFKPETPKETVERVGSHSRPLFPEKGVALTLPTDMCILGLLARAMFPSYQW